jgi:hypothetical protein
VTDEIDVVLAEAAELASAGPHFKIIHRSVDPVLECGRGEEVAWALLVHRGREYLLGLSHSILLMFDYLARNRWLPQSARQIVAGMRADSFYAKRKFSHASVKEYVKRIRRASEVAFHEAGLKLNPFDVLLSESTESNETRYRLKATIEWIHIDFTGPVRSRTPSICA